MTDRPDKNKEKVSLDVDLDDILHLIRNVQPKRAISDEFAIHAREAEELQKAWYKSIVDSMERLSITVDEIRRVEIDKVKKELKEEIVKIERNIEKLEIKVERNEKELIDYKDKVVGPLKDKVLTLTIKIGVWGTVAGFVGSGIMAIVLALIKSYVGSAAVVG